MRLMAACGALMPSSLPCSAEYGEGANVAVPALLPSPFKPTGDMARTCEVVALGREDVCLEPKKLLTAYDELRLAKAIERLQDQQAYAANEELRALLAAGEELIGLLRANRFDQILGGAVPKLQQAPLDTLAGGDSARVKRAAAVRKDVAALAAASKKGEASPTASVVLKLCNDLSSFADGV